MIQNVFSRILLILSVILFTAIRMNAQYTIQGTVVTAATGEPVYMANVQLFSGNANTFAGYGITDMKGAFLIKGSKTDSLRIVVASMGYKTYRQAVGPGETLIIKLVEEPFELQEVVVRPGRVWSRRDTVNYDVDRFISSKDLNIRDVLDKLPGIDVDEKGKISYQGKDISNLYVEGMEPVGGRYSQITNNLRADAVETVQVMENHQSIKMLEDIVASEDVALNLRLKAEFQAVWMFNVEGGIGITPLLWKTSDNGIRLSKTNQSIFSYKGNNTGNDVTNEQNIMGMRRNSLFETPSPLSFLSMPSIMAPLKKERLLFNDVHSFSANRMYKLNETTKMRINANYTHDERNQERGSETVYYMQDDTARISETSNTKLKSDEAALSIHIENNAPNKYLTNNFSLTGSRNRGVSDFAGEEYLTSVQRLQSASLTASNDFRTLWGKQDYRYEIKSLFRYDHQPEDMRTDLLRQKTLLNRLYTDNSFSITGQKGYFVPQISIGATGDVNNIQSGFTPYLAPSLQWNKEKWQTGFGLPVLWTFYPDVGFSRLSARPSANLVYKLNYAWRFSLSARYREQYGDILNFYPRSYYADYRHIIQTPGQLPVTQLQNYTAYGEYKKTASEFFASLSISYMQNKNSHIYEQTAENGYISLIPSELSNRNTSWNIAGTLSKGFYDIKLNTSLACRLSQSEGEQISKGERLPFLSNRISLEPKLIWNYLRNFEANYLATINLTGSTIGERSLNPLWSVFQKLQLSYMLPSVEINLTTDHYYNEVQNSESVNNIFLDLSCRYRHNKWRFSAELNNLLNKRQYGYTEYSGIRSYSSWIQIRGREFMVGAQYRF